ncbi:hypothetical protein HMPREF9439_01443 [Parasutterella excrementihominis YIT 11859]|uniref:Uncharacterized protein n=1 Tax=Parasutterella excrementihominis YIT 11859 TaxID=762966 RepID=F3QKI2_9BURK|nr:hypothetical protein HMPREF9439_01443 [Parasutterella excrementihominis YIT 11859]
MFFLVLPEEFLNSWNIKRLCEQKFKSCRIQCELQKTIKGGAEKYVIQN